MSPLTFNNYLTYERVTMKQSNDVVAKALAGCLACAANLFPPIGSAAPTVDPMDACTLLTAAEVSAALGVKVDAGKRPVENDPTLCNWRESGKPEGPARSVVVNVIEGGSFDKEKRPSRNLKGTVSGVGDEAYFFQPSRLPVILFVNTGTVYFKVMARSSATDPAAERNGAIDKTLAAAVVKKLHSHSAKPAG